MTLTPELSNVARVPDDLVVRRMVALFDYDPWESSPNIDSEVSFKLLYPFHISSYVKYTILTVFPCHRLN